MIDMTQELPMPICEKRCVCLRGEGEGVRMRHGAMGTGMRPYGHAGMATHTLMSQLKHVHCAAQVAIPHS
jgi:hypothetical protein